MESADYGLTKTRLVDGPTGQTMGLCNLAN